MLCMGPQGGQRGLQSCCYLITTAASVAGHGNRMPIEEVSEVVAPDRELGRLWNTSAIRGTMAL